ncbi:hypothetical protein [Psychrobacter piechaudii]|uniref:Uncharacterized protein n=1 Tax=Psychrobacter piechaudii TaxID=1945521 RepID=A0A1R4GJB5_9GAMM|nr:hypothetical protein [Psychrobacter piechaudii]SJM68175.1 hypothetical protein A1232T_00576 [Psychrobacter piechaudii]
MAQVAFSHQFSHRWSNAPQAVKDALLQEFEDIMQLLDAETDLENFEFTVPDLHAHIDAINAEVAAEKEVARLEAERLEAERLEAERAELEALEAERLLNEEQQAEQDALVQSELETDETLVQNPQAMQVADTELVEGSIDAGADTESAMDTDALVETEDLDTAEGSNTEVSDTPVEPSESQPTAEVNETEAEISAPASFAFDTTAPKAELDADFIKELESRIDDYLSEQLANMSEDLKSWLREQVANRFDDK